MFMKCDGLLQGLSNVDGLPVQDLLNVEGFRYKVNQTLLGFR